MLRKQDAGIINSKLLTKSNNASATKVRSLKGTKAPKGNKKSEKATKRPKGVKAESAPKHNKPPDADYPVDTTIPNNPTPPTETDENLGAPSRAPAPVASPTKAPDDSIGGRVDTESPTRAPVPVTSPTKAPDDTIGGSVDTKPPSRAPVPVTSPTKAPDDSIGGRVDTESPTRAPIPVTSPTKAPDDSIGGSVGTKPPSRAPVPVTSPTKAPDDSLGGRVQSPAPSEEGITVEPPSRAPRPTSPTDGKDKDSGNGDGKDSQPGATAPSKAPQPIPPVAPSQIPSDAPSMMPSGTPSRRPTVVPHVPTTASGGPTLAPVLSAGTQAPVVSPTESSYIPDPRDPTSFICAAEGDADAMDVLDDTISLPLNFTYQLWLDEPTTPLASVLPQVESAMAEAIANSLLTCQGFGSNRRHLLEGVWGVSSLPIDIEKERCSTACYRMVGRVTLEAVGTTEEENSNIICSALDVVQNPTTMTLVAMLVDGVGGLRFESSRISCGSGSDSAQKPSGSQGKEEQAQVNDSSLGGPATVGIIIASAVIVLLMFLAAVRRRRRESVDDALTEVATSKDPFTLQPTLSSPRSGVGFGGPGYTILADNQSMRDDEEFRSDLSSPKALQDLSPNNESLRDYDEEISDLSSPVGLLDPSPNNQSLRDNEEARSEPSPPAAEKDTSPTAEVPDQPLKITTWDPFRLDQTDLPDRLSLQSSEGGSFHDGGEDEDDSQNLTQYVNPVQLAAGRRKSPRKVASPAERGLQVPVEPLRDVPSTEESNEKEKVASPTYPGLTSLLGGESDGTSTDEDRSVVQLFAGGVRLLKLSDLEGNHGQDDESASSSKEDFRHEI